jgi:hypothetical protein
MVLGTVYFSCDKHGRNFPFIVYSIIENDLPDIPSYLLPLFYKMNMDFITLNYAEKINNFIAPLENITVTITGIHLSEFYKKYNDNEFIEPLSDGQSVFYNFSPGTEDLYSRICSLIQVYHISKIPMIFWTDNRKLSNRLFLFNDHLPSAFINLINPEFGNIKIINSPEATT